MDLGFIENKPYDEISIGDIATAEHVFTREDAIAFASVSGFTAVVNADGLADRDVSTLPPTGPNMWCASLISGIFATNIPGPGCTLTNVSLSFHNRIHVGERIFVKVEATAKDDATKTITFDCRARNGDGASVFTGSAQLIAPTEKLRLAAFPVPQLTVNNPHRHHLGWIARASTKPAVKTAVVWPCDELSLGGAIQGLKDKLIIPVLVGSEEIIRAIAETLQLDLGSTQIIDVESSRLAAIRAVEMARKGEVQMLMKGSLQTSELMEAVTARDGLRVGRRISHVFALDVPAYHKPLFVTDAAVNIQSDLDTKIDILQNAIDMMLKLEIVKPKVAILSSVESINPAIPSTLDAAALCKMVERGQITGGAIVDGPLAFDNAISAEAARVKKIKSPVAGDPDLLMVPNVEAGNILFKELQYLAGALAAGVVVGAKVPVVLTGRADGEQSRMASCALGVLLARPAPKQLDV
jgi:phosphotransacetylase/acyl dehydratase